MIVNELPPIYICSYKRAHELMSCKTMIYKYSYPPGRIYVLVDDESPEMVEEYRVATRALGVNLHVFSIEEARERFDFVFRRLQSQRAAGMARNMIHLVAEKNGHECYVVMDDDTMHFESKIEKKATAEMIQGLFVAMIELIKKHRIGLFGLLQSGDYMTGKSIERSLYRRKVMNLFFVNSRYLKAGERGTQDDDTAQFCNLWHQGMFTGSLADGVVLHQRPSATHRGGLTDIYIEGGLLFKALMCVVQFPSAVVATKQKMNGNRIHHKITYKYMAPMLLKKPGWPRSNIAWDTYDEDGIITLARWI